MATVPGSKQKHRFHWLNGLLKLSLVVVLIVIFNYLATRELHQSALITDQSSGTLYNLFALAAYALLLAIPFAPGMEIGVSLLVMQGAAIAPYVYMATVLGLSLAYGFGAACATRLPLGFLRRLGLERAYDFLETMRGLDHPQRLEIIRQAAPPWIGTWVIGRRYILLAILVNLPGNSLIGGGGGILLLAGLSRLFSYPLVLLTLLMATAPVPLAVWLLGVDILHS